MIVLNGNMAWFIEGQYEAAAFFNNLSILIPSDSTIYLEGTSIGHEVLTFLQTNKCEPLAEVLIGTKWPTPKRFHLPINNVVISGLIAFSNNHAQPEMFDHIVIYRESIVLLDGYDFGSDDLLVSESIDEKLIKDFSKCIGCNYSLKELERTA